jgi:invasion protein IalB
MALSSLSRLLMLSLAAVWSLTHAVAAQTTAASGPDRLTETYRDWTLRCGVPQNAPAGAARICEIGQELRREAGGRQQRVLTVLVARGVDNSGQLTLITPLGLALPAGLRLTVGEQAAVELSYSTCRPIGCISSIRLEGDLLAAFMAGTAATVRVRTFEGQDVGVGFSLNGFTEAWNRLADL